MISTEFDCDESPHIAKCAMCGAPTLSWAPGNANPCTSASTGTLYWLGPGGEVLDESDRSGHMQEEYIYFNGERIARRDVASNAVHYYFSNHLGSASVITDSSGNVQQQTDYYPYGGIAYSSGADNNHYKFTGKERDFESNLDNFGARYYTSNIGRFMTPDWDAKPVTVPYAKFGDPQTLNLYTYVENSPVNHADANGHFMGYQSRTCDCGGWGDVLFSAGISMLDSRSDFQIAFEAAVQVAAQRNGTAQNKPPTAAQIQKEFYGKYGKAFADAVNKAFGKDASSVLPQTAGNAPKLDISKGRAELGKMGKNPGELDDGRNRPNTATYQAKDGTLFISREAVAAGNMKSLAGTYGHELSNLLDFQVNGFKGYEQNYGNSNPKTNFGDPDTGMRVEVLMFGSPQ